MPGQGSDEGSQRIDTWLWAARFFKTRGLAAEAVSGGKVHVDGQRVKPARAVRPGMQIRVRRGQLEMTVVVQGLARQRRPAREAQQLYRETEESARRREEEAALRRQAGPQAVPGTRPSKRDRRQLERLVRRPFE